MDIQEEAESQMKKAAEYFKCPIEEIEAWTLYSQGIRLDKETKKNLKSFMKRLKNNVIS